ncbi:lytic transglycosylase domain-containing protein [Lacrimispora saccharolytica]|uniref:Lytic transglycosylase catalytic n=1 Tax=Lacrimispora saccharolytica (strain ATCC 35040 / DSM 2544 / NRCC 2533 / WM1) TaxID=610130 RepID=D9R9X1_LACSW|nr:lytic transglycosylase domain-containing protein [Lacrimispora saccharolytica]ADL05943.1 Lytic transglycosylase catalytic [[Clostridium] saccharolyticum WM1]
MATIDQLKLSALANARIGQAGYTAASSAKGSFKQILKSVVKAPESLEAIFSEASEKYGVSEKLLKAVAKAESNFNPSATSKKGAAGVMQLMPATARSLGVDDPYDARSNIMGGAKYLRENLERYNGNVDLTLAAYNAGSNNVSKYGGIPPFKETQEYVKKVKNYMGAGDTETAGYSLNATNPLEYLTGRFREEENESLVPEKSDYLYLIELMKLRMQMASYRISSPLDSEDTSAGSMYHV